MGILLIQHIYQNKCQLTKLMIYSLKIQLSTLFKIIVFTFLTIMKVTHSYKN